MTWKTPTLVQRLNEPEGTSYGNQFPESSGLTQHAMELLRPVFSLDDMKDKRFADGLVAEKLCDLALAGDRQRLVANSMNLENPENTAWYICKKRHEEDLLAFMNEQYSEKSKDELYTGMRAAFLHNTRVHGWLELTNGSIFTRSEQMYKQLKEIFVD